MFRNRRRKGFVLAEFAIALPLLILIGYGLALVGVKIFEQDKDQLADYVLDAEAQYVMERITHQARVAKEVHVNSRKNSVQFVYHTAVNDRYDTVHSVADVQETQYFIPHEESGVYVSLNAKRTNSTLRNPITGGNSFGDTQINSLQFRELENNVLHIALEMESRVTHRKIKIATAVFMPGCDTKDGLQRYVDTSD